LTILIDNLTTKNRTRVVFNGDSGSYVSDAELCTCPSGSFGSNDCKHRRIVRKLPIEFGKIREQIIKFPSTLEGFNKAFGGSLYSSDEMVAFYGKPKSGKSLLLTQEMFGLASQGYNILYIGTEGGEQEMIDRWYDVYSARFFVGVKGIGKMYLETRKSLESLMEYFGYKVRVSYVSKKKSKGEGAEADGNDKGKMEFRVVEKYDSPEIDAFIEKNHINMVVLDSLTSPIRQSITDEQQNNPAKASATALICGKLLKLQEKYKTGLVVIGHAMFNPADPYETSASMRGGIVIAHYAKRVLYIDKRDKNALRDFRRVWVARAEDKPEFSEVIGLKISDAGVDDVADMTELLTDNEKSKLSQ
jgi:predicted ATP-dependent serine protease